ncbi:hypothetical protein DPMN_188277 [Dreissena polymorpha]|uniref:Uncharacterized protein n=1 Tax=Dreissena polymorpha TaxID=45954 RepID=A0A9D4DT43_DREPO|nr:hypothetical protein DPMN_188277 [Dreissena polymorpha]
MGTVESVSWEEPVHGVYGGDNENAPRVGSELPIARRTPHPPRPLCWNVPYANTCS